MNITSIIQWILSIMDFRSTLTKIAIVSWTETLGFLIAIEVVPSSLLLQYCQAGMKITLYSRSPLPGSSLPAQLRPVFPSDTNIILCDGAYLQASGSAAAAACVLLFNGSLLDGFGQKIVAPSALDFRSMGDSSGPHSCQYGMCINYIRY